MAYRPDKPWSDLMQTFLPYADYEMSAECLDRQRLGKQRVEVLQILNVLHELRQGYRNHPAVLMWRGHAMQLAEYGLVICDEWKKRGYRDTCYDKIRQHQEWAIEDSMAKPDWFGDVDFHLGHQAALLRKDPDWYGPKFPNVNPDRELIWPVRA